MENMMRSLAQIVIDNAAAKLGIPAGDVQLILDPQRQGDTDADRRNITIRCLRTIEAEDDDQPVGNSSVVWDGEIDSFLTVFEVLVSCRPLTANRPQDYYPNEARTLAETVRRFFRGKQNTGLVIDRIAYDKAGTPVEGAGVAKWQRTDSQPEVPGDQVRTMVLTFELHWWAPAVTD